MGLSTKQVSGDHELDWSHTLLQSPTLEIPKPPPTRRQPPPQSEQLKCPRCESTNTKFCYYNNYNKLQPRHFCKSCKRHWTKGGTLRNVPVGGGRKNKRLKRSNSATTTAAVTTNRSNSQMGIHSLIRPPSLLQDDLMPSIPPPPAVAATAAEHQNQRLQFSFSNLSYFDTNPSPIFTSPPLLHAYNHAQKLEDEETIATSCGQPWQIPSSSSNVMETPNYWNWNYLDTMVTADLNIPWDDIEIKP